MPFVSVDLLPGILAAHPMLDATNPEEARVWHGPLVVFRPIRRDIHTKSQRKISTCCEQKSQAAYTRSGTRTAGPVGARWTLTSTGVASTRPPSLGRNRLEPLQVFLGENDRSGSRIITQIHAPLPSRHRILIPP